MPDAQLITAAATSTPPVRYNAHCPSKRILFGWKDGTQAIVDLKDVESQPWWPALPENWRSWFTYWRETGNFV